MACKECVHFGICKKGFPWADGKGSGWCEDFKYNADMVKIKHGKSLSRFYKFDTTPEGETFIEISDETHAMRIYQSGVQEFYTDGELILKVDPTYKAVEIQPTQMSDIFIKPEAYGEKIIYQNKKAERGF